MIYQAPPWVYVKYVAPPFKHSRGAGFLSINKPQKYYKNFQ